MHEWRGTFLGLWKVTLIVYWAAIAPGLSARGAPLQMYWTDHSGVMTASTSDLIVRDVVANVQNTKGIDIAGGYVYWTTLSQRQVLKTPISGGPSTVLYQGSAISRPEDVAIDQRAGRMYWTDSATWQIWRSDLDGNDAEVIVNTNRFNPPGSITIDSDAQRIYWTAYPGGIYSSDVDGSDVRSVVALGTSSSASDIALDVAAQKMYWADLRLSSISRSNLDGSEVERIHRFPTFTSPKGIDLDLAAGKLYWVTGAGRNIQRSNLDGSNVETVLEGLVQPVLLKVVPLPEPASAMLAIAGLLMVAASHARKIARNPSGGKQVVNRDITGW